MIVSQSTREKRSDEILQIFEKSYNNDVSVMQFDDNNAVKQLSCLSDLSVNASVLTDSKTKKDALSNLPLIIFLFYIFHSTSYPKVCPIRHNHTGPDTAQSIKC